ncbi:MAG TPA: pyridoxamine 5'-phosphate oxidase family protein [Xanthobacteraceae bacterium]|nr:pyridoxamine 5'-phosphate oxidase family protein [Xanthobacteraceae bacterium]
MKARLKDLVLRLLKEHRVMTIATNRPDGWPQATIVGYVNDGLTLYCFIARDSQKHLNVLRDARVSIAIGNDAKLPLDIKGLSLAGKAYVVDDAAEWNRVTALRRHRYPEYAALPPPVFAGDALARIAPQPPAAQVVLLGIEPDIVSVIDYSQGFGHSDLIAVSRRDVDRHLETARHHWHGAHHAAAAR